MTNLFLKLGHRVLRGAGTVLLDMSKRVPVYETPSAEGRKALSSNQIFKDRHRGQRCFIIANGPSLKSQDILPLGNEITFVMSGFWQHPVVERWQPTYYCVSDPIYFDGSEPMREFFRSLVSGVSASTFFVPLSARDAVKEQKLLPLEQTHWVAFHGDLGSEPLQNLDFTGYVPSAMSVSQLCLMMAIYMGCSPIYLLGFDHDWLSHLDKHHHFYAGLGGLEKHPQVRPDMKDHSYRVVMECALIIWRGYEELLALAQRQGISIFNATNGGFLDVFERVRYEDVIDSISTGQKMVLEPA